MNRPHALRIAVWVVIASEALLFGGLFMIYGAYHAEHAEAFRRAGAHDIGWIGGTNTMVLLVSSFFAAAAIHLRSKALVLPVIGLGVVFLGFKALEWTIHIRDGIVPGSGPRGESLFYTLYYLMTGLHALHVVAGVVLMVWARSRLSVLPLVGLYWHFVDVVWVFLWPLFYLVT